MSESTDRDVKKATKTLQKAFASSNKQDKAVFDKTIESIMQTKEGQETLMALSKLGYSFEFDKGNFSGFCDSENKKIILSPSDSIETLMPTIVHEARHAVQRANVDIPAMSHTTVASSLRHRRAIEADAVAYEVAFVYGAKDQFPEMYAAESNTPMFKAYEKEMEASGDVNKAMKASFEAWYSYDYYRNYYDKSHKEDIKDFCDFGKKNKSSRQFSEEIPVSDLAKICSHDGQSYISEDFLNSEQACSIPRKDQLEIMAAVEDYARRTGAPVDYSVFSMPLREGGFAPEYEEENDQPLPNTPVNEEEQEEEMVIEEAENEDKKKPKNENPQALFSQVLNANLKMRYHNEESKEDNRFKDMPFEYGYSITDARPREQRVDITLNSGTILSNYPKKVSLNYQGKTRDNPDALFRECMATARLGKEKGWTAIKIKGPKEFQEQMYLACRASGVEPRGFIPSKELQKQGDLMEEQYAQTREHMKSVDQRFPELEKIRKKGEIDSHLVREVKRKGLGYTPAKPSNPNDKKAKKETSPAESLKAKEQSPAERLKSQGDKMVSSKQSALTAPQTKESVVNKALMNKLAQARSK